NYFLLETKIPMPLRAPVRWPSEKRTLRFRHQGSHLNTHRRVCDWTTPTHLCLPHVRCLACERMKDVGTNTVRRTNGLGIKESLLGNRSESPPRPEKRPRGAERAFPPGPC